MKPQGDNEQGGRVDAKNGDLGKDKGRLKMDYYSIEHIKLDGSIGGFRSNADKSL